MAKKDKPEVLVPVEKVAYLLAAQFDSPCNYTPLDEEMVEYCGESCDMDDVACWERWLIKRLKGGKNNDGSLRQTEQEH
ncbi:MAG: hypothetical protein J6Y20_07360 [Lachnospiraceae bacterium]|nr:hypothetical protein [Lachnospiraceae bacterium]